MVALGRGGVSYEEGTHVDPDPDILTFWSGWQVVFTITPKTRDPERGALQQELLILFWPHLPS